MNHAVEHWCVSKSSVKSSHGAVAAQHSGAAKAGAEVLGRGGNAIDAAVATAFALGVVEPWMCGIGGSGYMVVWHAATKTSRTFDFQGVLPGRIDPSDYPLEPSVEDSIMGFPGVVDNRNVTGYAAITIPGAVKGLSVALERFGSLPFSAVLQPAIELAGRGLPVNWFTTLQIALAARELSMDPVARSIYLPDGVPPQPEQYLDLGQLRNTLITLAGKGADALYGGVLGQAMVDDLQAGGARIDLDDFKQYQVLEAETLDGEHRGAQLHTAGETSGGPRLLEALAYIEKHLDVSDGRPGPASWKIYADALNSAWRSHNRKIGRTTEIGGCTSHLSTVDRHGNMVALTYTLLSRFGSAVVLPQSGVLMNNAVSYFDPRPGYPTSMAAAKRINASNMCPTIATRNDRALFAIGASGANYIMPCVAQIAALMLDYNLSLEQAVNHPRLDASDRQSVRADPALGEAVLQELARYHDLEVAQRLVYPKLYACASGVSFDVVSGVAEAINDPSQPVGAGVGGNDAG